MSNNSRGNDGLVQSVDRALTVLQFLARDGQLGITDIAARLGVHKSTAFRLVATLESHGLVEQDSGRGKYRLGAGLVRLAGASTARLDLVQESRPVCSRLAATVGETVNIAVLSGPDALYLDQVSGPSALQLQNWVGQRIPLHATSNGKVLLAHAPAADVEELIGGGLRRFTERTITDLDVLRAELEAVRKRGYATATDELELGLTAVAAPILDTGGAVIAAVSASGPSFRLSEDRLPEVAGQVMEAAVQISHRLGWHGVPGPPRAGAEGSRAS
jgi:DNA-binding IclR family transcriptional regulator